MATQTQPSQPALTWYSPKEPPLRLAGFAWFAANRLYRRLPETALAPLPPAVDSLANCTAGGQIQFQTDAAVLSVRVKLRGKPNMDHMPATGQCGVDCYLGTPGAMHYRSNKCDLDLATLKKGSPHSLICTKNQASYLQRARQREMDLQILARIEAL